MKNAFQCLLWLARWPVSTHDIVRTCLIGTWLPRPETQTMQTILGLQRKLFWKCQGKKGKRWELDPKPDINSNNSILQPAILIFPLINRWQQSAKDANLGPESPSEGIWAQRCRARGHREGGGMACGGVQVTVPAPSFPSSSTCLCGMGQGQHAHTLCFESVTQDCPSQRCANSAAVDLFF